MSKRRVASVLMFGDKHSLRYPVNVVARASGTGTETGDHVITVVAATQAYVNVDSSTNVGTLVGTA